MRLLVLAAAGAALACGDSGYDSGAPAPAPAACTAATATAVSGPIQLVAGNRFVPSCARVAVGSDVTFTNVDATPMLHTVTADSGQFDSGNLALNQSFAFTFASAGTVGIHCELHPGMRMTLFVE
jgi:plastocyanin